MSDGRHVPRCGRASGETAESTSGRGLQRAGRAHRLRGRCRHHPGRRLRGQQGPRQIPTRCTSTSTSWRTSTAAWPRQPEVRDPGGHALDELSSLGGEGRDAATPTACRAVKLEGGRARPWWRRSSAARIPLMAISASCPSGSSPWASGAGQECRRAAGAVLDAAKSPPPAASASALEGVPTSSAPPWPAARRADHRHGGRLRRPGPSLPRLWAWAKNPPKFVRRSTSAGSAPGHGRLR